MVKIITDINAKGGVGKTTTSMCVAACLARMGYRGLLIDTDQSANATDAMCDQKIEKTIKDLFQGTPVKEVIYPSVEPGLDIIPSCPALSTIETELNTEYAREIILKTALEPVKNDYDIIIIDTRPSFGVIPINALCAADEVIIPISGAFSVDALAQMVNIMMLIKNRRLNPNLVLGGILLTMYDPRTNMAKEIRQVIGEQFKSVLFETTIPRNIDLEYCTRKKQSIFQYNNESTGAQAYEALTNELLTMWGMKK